MRRVGEIAVNRLQLILKYGGLLRVLFDDVLAFADVSGQAIQFKVRECGCANGGEVAVVDVLELGEFSLIQSGEQFPGTVAHGRAVFVQRIEVDPEQRRTPLKRHAFQQGQEAGSIQSKFRWRLGSRQLAECGEEIERPDRFVRYGR